LQWQDNKIENKQKKIKRLFFFPKDNQKRHTQGETSPFEVIQNKLLILFIPPPM